MKFRQQNTTLGLDVGQSYVRLVKLKRSGKKFTVERAEELNIAAEGILDEEELFSESGLGKWLKERKLDTLPICLGLPQYLCTTRNVNDFKANAKQEQLEQMVQFETTQLAGLSEETFLSDYQRMTPAYGVEAPIIIGFGREAGSEEMAAKCAKIPIKLADLAMGSFALANAFCYLHPEELENDNPQVIIDLGTENSTIVIMVHGNVVYTGSMMFGGKRFTQVLAATMECTEADAEKMKQDYVPDWDDNESPYIFATRQLETELKTSIENWRSGEIAALADLEISKMWLCGGAARTIGLAEHLQRLYGCPVELLGPSISPTTRSEKKEAPAKTVPDKKESPADIPQEEIQPASVEQETTALHNDASPDENNQESPQNKSEDDVPDGISNIFSSIKLKVHVPPPEEADSNGETQDILADEDNAPNEHPPLSIKVTLPTPNEEKASDEPPSEAFNSKASVFTTLKLPKPKVKATMSMDIATEFTLAFGLALQTTGNAAYPISLAPMLRRWQIQREDHLQYLVLTVVFLFMTIAGSMVFADFWMRGHIDELNEGMDKLRECDKLVPKLDTALSQIEYQQRLLLPFVELGGRSKTFMKALTVINEAKGPKDWCFYFADQYSYADNNAIQRTEDTKRGGKSGKGGVVIETTDSARDGRRALSNTGGVDMFSTMLLPQQEQKIDIKDEHKVVLDTMPLLTYLIMAGYTPVENNKRYAGVLRLQDNLRPSSGKKEKGNTSTEAANAPKKIDTIFTDQVDTMEVDWQGNGINLETGWNLYLKSQKAQFGEFTEFKLILPLAKKQVDIPPPKEPPKKPKKK